MKPKYVGLNLKPATAKFFEEQGKKEGRKLGTELRVQLEKLEAKLRSK